VIAAACVGRFLPPHPQQRRDLPAPGVPVRGGSAALWFHSTGSGKNRGSLGDSADGGCVKEGLVPGASAEVSFVVLEAMCPAFDGRVVHRVCSTWTLVHHMELAGRKVLVDFLEPEEEGIGSHVSCDHLGPARVGSIVRVVATARDVTDRELVCDTVAFCGERMIAAGRTVQKVFPRAVLERILSKG